MSPDREGITRPEGPKEAEPSGVSPG